MRPKGSSIYHVFGRGGAGVLHSKGGLFQRCTFRFECHGRKVSVSLRLGEMKKLFAFLRNRLDPRPQGLLSRQHITVWSIGALKPALYKCMASNYREKFVMEAARENAVFPCPLSPFVIHVTVHSMFHPPPLSAKRRPSRAVSRGRQHQQL